jgi:hypothetical protein
MAGMVVVLTPFQWRCIREDLHTMYPPSVFMLRNKMKGVLGFTVREHNEYHEPTSEDDLPPHTYTIRLDFYNERKYTMFLLKFSDKIGKQ